MPNNDAHLATAQSNTVANVTVFTPDGKNETAVSETSNELVPDDVDTDVASASNIRLHIITKMLIEIPVEGDPISSSKTTVQVVATDLDGEYADSIADVSSDADGGTSASGYSNVFSKGDDEVEEGETVYLTIETIFNVHLPKNNENLATSTNTSSKMLLLELDGSNSTSEAYVLSETGENKTEDSTTVKHLDHDRMEIHVKSDITVKMPSKGMPKAESSTDTNIVLINKDGTITLSSSDLDISLDSNSDEAEDVGSVEP